MANPHKGEVEIKVGDDSYKLSFSAGALCELEDMLDMGVAQFGSLMSDPEKVSMRNMRKIFHAGLLDHHPDMNAEMVKVLFSQIAPTDAVAAIMQAFNLAFPAAPADASAGGAGNPPKPGPDGSGRAS